MTILTKKGSDNALENYFLDLLVHKHIIDREIQDILNIIEKSNIHSDYQLLIKRILFGEKNIYIENWGTLGSSLQDVIKSMDIRGNNIRDYGIVLKMMIGVIEKIFDVDDEHFHDFVLSAEREDIEHQLIIIMKRSLDFMELGLKDLLEHAKDLDQPKEGGLKDEYIIIEAALKKYPSAIVEAQQDGINRLKICVDVATTKIHNRRLQQGRI